MHMKYGSLIELVGALPCFDLALLAQGFDEPREHIRVQLSRWIRLGKVIGLRRGMYALSGPCRPTLPPPEVLAGRLYSPSYLSSLWALGYYDLIPEHVVWMTSVTSRVPRHFENPVGVFDYRNIKRDAFFGYVSAQYGGQDILVAEPEKALLDHWHLTLGEWTPERLNEMRYQRCDRIAEDRLRTYAQRFRSPRLNRAVERWLTLAENEEKGTVTL